ncbi:hypothetical protein K440DRAFT_524765, partial [Wilcoxina mikolae CBS 423.85]
IEAENRSLKARIQQLEDKLSHYRSSTATQNVPPSPIKTSPTSTTLEPSEYIRYGRQLILPQIGLPGQKLLKSAKVLVIGAGGLGCPAATYLSASGIGTLGIIDHDAVELSNLHRQTLHTTSRIGLPKVLSAISSLREINPNITYIPHHYALSPENALATIADYDVILDCTDHPSLRYLISDVCVLLHKPLVSASALRTDGQLIVLNSPPGKGPCYRCIWPRPPPAESVTSCGDGGVLGPVVGVMGVLQALEVVKLITSPAEERNGETAAVEGRMLFFSAYAGQQFRTLRMRGRRKTCISCGEAATITPTTIPSYETFCGLPPDVPALPAAHRRSVAEVKAEKEPVIVDIRDATQFGICAVRGSVNIPFSLFQNAAEGRLPEEMVEVLGEKEGPVVMLCRLGNDSQIAARQVFESDQLRGREVFDVVGGIREWART